MVNKKLKAKLAGYLSGVEFRKGSFVVLKKGRKTYYKIPLLYCYGIANGFMDYISQRINKKWKKEFEAELWLQDITIGEDDLISKVEFNGINDLYNLVWKYIFNEENKEIQTVKVKVRKGAILIERIK